MRHPVGQVVFVRLVRAWRAARAAGENPLPHVQAGAAPFDPAPGLSVACHSLLELTEAQLGRPLETECCCSRDITPDEAAMIGLLLHAQDAGSVMTTEAIPHGLPGAIRWAAFAVLRGLRETLGTDAIGTAPPFAAGMGCPFNTALTGAPRAA